MVKTRTSSPKYGTMDRTIETFHTSGRGITNGGRRQGRAEGAAHVVAALREATSSRRCVKAQSL